MKYYERRVKIDALSLSEMNDVMIITLLKFKDHLFFYAARENERMWVEEDDQIAAKHFEGWPINDVTQIEVVI